MSGLFYHKETILNDQGTVNLFSGALGDCSEIIQHLDQLIFTQNQITMFGKTVDVPRLELWFGEKSYTYSGVTNPARPYPKWLIDFQSTVMNLTECEFNSVLINKYRDGNDYVSYHRDDEPELGPDPIIASVSFGQSRKFVMRKLDDKNVKNEITLNHGDVLLFGKGCQINWEHALPKTKRASGLRYNLTFRKIY